MGPLNLSSIFQFNLATNVCNATTYSKLQKRVKRTPKSVAMIIEILARCLDTMFGGSNTLYFPVNQPAKSRCDGWWRNSEFEKSFSITRDVSVVPARPSKRSDFFSHIRFDNNLNAHGIDEATAFDLVQPQRSLIIKSFSNLEDT